VGRIIAPDAEDPPPLGLARFAAPERLRAIHMIVGTKNICVTP
jgi:hypothetical protein